ncbi:XRE family transcriptional regulator [Kingella bonacorsii]|nr:XRE family transcriptional regulator [Kingella bonacorsii]
MFKDYMNEGWFALLKARIAAASLRQVAAELGYSGTTLSLIVHGKYAGKTDRVAAAVAARYETVACPYQGKTIPLHECRDTASGKAPTHNPIKMQQWLACQKCAKRCGQ